MELTKLRYRWIIIGTVKRGCRLLFGTLIYRKMRIGNRKILLLVDNAPTHNLLDIELTNVTIHYLPPNTTAYLQPLDAGIIHSFKVCELLQI